LDFCRVKNIQFIFLKRNCWFKRIGLCELRHIFLKSRWNAYPLYFIQWTNFCLPWMRCVLYWFVKRIVILLYCVCDIFSKVFFNKSVRKIISEKLWTVVCNNRGCFFSHFLARELLTYFTIMHINYGQNTTFY